MADSDLFQVSLKDFLLEEYLRKQEITDVFKKPQLWGVDFAEGKVDKSAYSSLTTSTKQLDNVGLSPLYRTNYTEAWTETAPVSYSYSQLSTIDDSKLLSHMEEFYKGLLDQFSTSAYWSGDTGVSLSKGPKEVYVCSPSGSIERVDNLSAADLEKVGWKRLNVTLVCEACNGHGMIKGEICWHCDGEGIDPLAPDR